MVVAVACRKAASFSTACAGGSYRAGIGVSSLAGLEAMRYSSALGIGCGDGRVESSREGIPLSEFVGRRWGLVVGTLEGRDRRLRRRSSLPLSCRVEGRDKKMRSSGSGAAFFLSSAMMNAGISTPPPSVVKFERSPGKTANANMSSMELPTNESSERLVRIRHSCAHVMAMAVQRLFPEFQVSGAVWRGVSVYSWCSALIVTGDDGPVLMNA